TAIDGMNVAAGLPRNRKITSTTRMTARVSSICTSWTEARIVVVRSVRTDTLTDEGRVDSSVGRSRFTRSTTWIRLAPGWRWMLTMTAGSVPIQAAWRTFSASSMVSATSERWTGAPLRYAMTRLRYCSLETSWSLAPMVKAWRGPSRLPLAWFTVALATGARRSSRVSELAASRAGFAWMRMAGF